MLLLQHFPCKFDQAFRVLLLCFFFHNKNKEKFLVVELFIIQMNHFLSVASGGMNLVYVTIE